MRGILTVTASAAALAASAAAAQEAPAPPNATTPADTRAATPQVPEAGRGPGDIVVTAQKREERLQDVPVAVSVVSGDALAAVGRVNLEGAVNLVPTLNVQKSGTTLNQSIFLRGVGTATFSIAGEPSVSTVVDGVVYSRSGEAFSDLVDVERLEVLRGPQGTLFGKNASAGVINIVSRKPTRELGGYVEGGFFTREEYRARGALNVPLSDDLLTRVTGFWNKWDGNIRNTAARGDGARVNGLEHYGGRLQVLWTPSSVVTVNLSADYHRNDDDCCAEVIGTTAIRGSDGAAIPNPIFAVLPTPRGDETRRIAQNLVTRTREEGYGFSGQIDIDLAPVTVTSITAYRNWRNREIRDGDFLDRAYVGFPQIHDDGPQTGDTITQELRVSSQGRNLIDYTAGLFYSRADSARTFSRSVIQCDAASGADAATPIPCDDTARATNVRRPFGRADFGSLFTNMAAFGQATLNLTGRLRLIGGIRYTNDQLEVSHIRRTTLAGPGIQPGFDQGVFDAYTRLVASGVASNVAATQAVASSNGIAFRAKTTNDNWSGKAGAQFDVTDDITAYGTWARGYKGPAFNIFYNLTSTGTNVIEPETSDAYEAGLKNTFFDGRLVLNVAAFYAKYRNFQANNPDFVSGVLVTRFTNAGTVSTRGAEIDLSWQPVSDLALSGGLAYADAQVDRFNVAPGAPTNQIVPDGTPLAFAPKWKGSLGADYRWRTGGAIDALFGAQGSYQSRQITQFSPDAVVRRLSTVDGYGLVNLSAGVTDADDRYRLLFQVRNLFDRSFAAAIASGGPGGAYRYQIPRDADRYYGVTARVNF